MQVQTVVLSTLWPENHLQLDEGKVSNCVIEECLCSLQLDIVKIGLQCIYLSSAGAQYKVPLIN